MSIENILRRHLGVAKEKHVQEDHHFDSSDLVGAINEFLVRRNKKEFIKIDAFHPSYTSVCVRWWYLMFNGLEVVKPFDARTHRIFDYGNDMHERFCSYFKNMGILVDTEIPVKLDEPVPIRGRADAIIKWPKKDGKLRVVELKSISPDGFTIRKHYQKPREDHMAQIQIYMKALAIHDGIILYEDKGSQALLSFDVTFDEELFEKKVRVWKRAYKYITEGTLPARPYKKNSEHCTSCDIRDLCWGMPE